MRATPLGGRTASLPKRRTAVLIWTDPLMGSGAWTPELVELAGGLPVVAFPGADARGSPGTVASADPEVVILTLPGMHPNAAAAAVEALRRTEARWGPFAARRRVVLIDGHRYAKRPSPRLIDTAELFSWAIHPELAQGSDFGRSAEILERPGTRSPTATVRASMGVTPDTLLPSPWPPGGCSSHDRSLRCAS